MIWTADWLEQRELASIEDKLGNATYNWISFELMSELMVMPNCDVLVLENTLFSG